MKPVVTNRLSLHPTQLQSMRRAIFTLLGLSLCACMHAQPVPSPSVQKSSEAANVSSVVDEKQMVDDMMRKIRSFLTNKPQTAEEIMTLFEFKEVRRDVNSFKESTIRAHGKFPYSQTEYNNWNAHLLIDSKQVVASFWYNLYKKGTERPQGAPWCFPNKQLLALLDELKFVPKRWDNGKTTYITHLRQVENGVYEELTFNEANHWDTCFTSFSYRPIAPLNHIKM